MHSITMHRITMQRITMHRLRSAFARNVVALVAFVAVGTSATGAAAYFAASGAGSASALTATLEAPANVHASVVGASRVNVTWDATTVAGVSIDGYRVERRTTNGVSAACGGALLTALACDDTNLVPGTYTYDVVAVFRSWTATSAETVAVTVRGASVPAAPASVQLAGGGSLIGSSAQANVAIDVVLAPSSDATDTVVLDLADDESAHTLTRTLPSLTGGGTVHFTGLDLSSFADGPITVRVAVRDANGTSSASVNASATKDTAAPVLSSLDRAASSPTNATTLTWTATFSEPVQHVTSASFTVVKTAVTGTAPTIVSVTPSVGTTWTVAVDTRGASASSGTIAVSLTGAAAIDDPAGNALATTTPFTGQAYTFDTVPPTVSVPDLVAANDTGSSSTDNVTNETRPRFTGTADAGVVTLYDDATAIGSASVTNGQWGITPASPLANGAHTITARMTDAAGNTTSTGSLTVTIDTVAPSVTGITLFNGGVAAKADESDTVQIAFSERLAVSTMCGSWSDDTQDQVSNNPTVTGTITNGGTNETLTFADANCSGGLNVGTVSLGADYVTATTSFKGSSGHASTVWWNPATNVLRYKLGAVSGGQQSNLKLNVVAGTPRYTPPTATRITDVAGNALVASFTSTTATGF